MLRSIEIEDLRGIKSGRLSEMTEMNIIVGPNNSGKSTILDAINLGVSPEPMKAFGELLSRRSVLEIGNWVVRRSVRDEPILAAIEVVTSGGFRKTEILRLPPEPASDGTPLKLRWLQQLEDGTKVYATTPPRLDDVAVVRQIDPKADQAQLAELFTRTSEVGLLKQAKEFIRAVIPDLEDIQILSQKNQPVLYLLFPRVVHPIKLAGDGIVLLVKLVFELATTSGGIALLEEPETHLHPAAMGQAAKALHEATKRGVQVVLTTHSLDLIDRLLAEFQGSDLAKLSVFRVQLNGGELQSYRLTGQEALRSRSDIEDDLR